MLLAIDIGNTNTVFALCDNEIIAQWRISTNAQRTGDEYAVWLLQLMQHEGIEPSAVKAAILSSVVPEAVFAISQCCKAYFHTECALVGDARMDVGIEVKIDRPNELGADRLVNAVAAWNRFAKPMVIVDFGTATTFDVVDAEGAYVGGVIAPGVNLSLEALQKAAAKLPGIRIRQPEKVIGTGTVGAMRSGIYYGYVGMIEGIVSRIKQEYGAEMTVVATGGLASLYAAETDMIDHVDSDLTMQGLHLIYQRNKT